MISAELNTASWHHALDGLSEAVGGDAKDLLIQEHDRLTRTIVNFTPPPIGQGSPKTLGENAIRKDLSKLISEAKPELIDSIGARYGLTDIDTYRHNKAGDLIHYQWDNIDPTGDRLSEYHERYRNHMGRIPSLKAAEGVWKSRVVTIPGKRDEYAETVFPRVGRWKAKWAYAASLRGSKFPTWISRHFGSLGGKAIADFDLGDTKTPSITFGAIGPSVRRDIAKIQDALRTRVRAMTNRAKLILSGYSKDMAAGMKPKRHANENPQPAEAVA